MPAKFAAYMVDFYGRRDPEIPAVIHVSGGYGDRDGRAGTPNQANRQARIGNHDTPHPM
jgi:hypothetical protein